MFLQVMLGPSSIWDWGLPQHPNTKTILNWNMLDKSSLIPVSKKKRCKVRGITEVPKAGLVAIFTFWTRGSTGALRALLGASFTLSTWRLQHSLQSELRFQAKGGPRAPGPLHGCDWDKIPLDMSSHRNVGWSNRERSYLSNKQKKKLIRSPVSLV